MCAVDINIQPSNRKDVVRHERVAFSISGVAKGDWSMALNRSIIPNNLLTACMFEDSDAALNTDEIPLVVEMNKQFGSAGSTVNLSGQDLSDWVSMQSLCARLSRSDNAKSIIYLDHCRLGRHGAAIVSRSFTHVLIRAGSYVAKWLPLMHPNGRIIVLRYTILVVSTL
jgi:hypothetical protein